MTSYNNQNQSALSQSKSDIETYLALNMAAIAKEEDFIALAQVVRQVYDPNFDMSVYGEEFRVISTYKLGEIVDGIVKVSYSMPEALAITSLWLSLSASLR